VFGQSLPDVATTYRAILTAALPGRDGKWLRASRTDAVEAFWRTMTGTAALRTEAHYTISSGNDLPAMLTMALRLLRSRVARILPIGNLGGMAAFKCAVLAFANDLQHKRQLAACRSKHLRLSAILAQPAFDFDVAVAVYKEVRRVAMLRAVGERYQELLRLIDKGVLAVSEIASIVGFPAGAHIKAEIGPESTDTVGGIGGLMRGCLANARGSETSASAILAGSIARKDGKRLTALLTYEGNRFLTLTKSLLGSIAHLCGSLTSASRTETVFAYVARFGRYLRSTPLAIVGCPLDSTPCPCPVGTGMSTILTPWLSIERRLTFKAVL
jgi:hypothetical protein